MGLIHLIRETNFSFAGVLIYILSSFAVIFLTLPVHEFAHGFIATKLGDPTPRYQGRLTLNPFAHIDYIGALCIILFGFGWAKPVQVNMQNFKNPKNGMAITALAGPVSNLIVAFIALLLLNFIGVFIGVSVTSEFSFLILLFLEYIARINVSLAVFNLIPIPPLDGSRILSALLPYKQYYALMRYERYIVFGVFVLLWLGFLDIPLSIATNGILNILDKLAHLPFGFIG